MMVVVVAASCCAGDRWRRSALVVAGSYRIHHPRRRGAALGRPSLCSLPPLYTGTPRPHSGRCPCLYMHGLSPGGDLSSLPSRIGLTLTANLSALVSHARRSRLLTLLAGILSMCLCTSREAPMNCICSCEGGAVCFLLCAITAWVAGVRVECGVLCGGGVGVPGVSCEDLSRV